VLAGIFFEEGNQFGHRMDRNRRVDHQDVIAGAGLNQRCEVTLQVELRVGDERRNSRNRSGDRQEGVAISGLIEGLHRADGHHGAGLVLDHHFPAFSLRQCGGDDACEDVGRRARRRRHHDTNDV